MYILYYYIFVFLDRLTISIETEIDEEFHKDLDSPEQFSQELIKWKMRNNDNATSGITSLEEAITICDSDFFPNISVNLLVTKSTV